MAEPHGTGLTSAEAAARLSTWGPNAIPERHSSAIVALLRKLWGPIPWMLEAALALELALGKFVEAALLSALLLVNGLVSFSHERRASSALELLRAKLRVLTRVRRDGRWSRISADALVPGDLVHVRMGDFVPADLRLADGDVLLDESTLTGESVPVEIGTGDTAPAGATVKRGEATGEVVATGARTTFGKTVSLVQGATGRNHLEALVVTMVKAFVALNVVLAVCVLVVAVSRGEPLVEIVPFVLMLLIASVPVALPAMFTLATAIGAAELGREGVLVTRLAALEEVAGLDVLCADKTGTLTQNRLALVAVKAAPAHTEGDVIELAAAASDASTQDPIDLAILDAANRRGARAADRVAVIPFDPATKRAEAVVRRKGAEWRVVKGAPATVLQLVSSGTDLAPEIGGLAAIGCRVLAVAAGPERELRLVGLVGLLDPARDDSKTVVSRLREFGVRLIMVTGDSPATAATVAADIGMGTRVATSPDADPATFDVLAGVLPEDKLRLIRSLQSAGHVTGMTGDGVNDAPALERADVGVAVSSAVDVAKSAASLVLTGPGLSGVLTAIEVGRRIYQRMLTYTLNMSVKKLEIPVFLAVGFLALHTYVITPRLLLLLILTNDLSTMTLAADRARASPRPERWRGRALVLTAFGIALPWLAFLLAVVEVGRRVGHLAPGPSHTLVFLALVFMGQANVYLLRERGHLWTTRPGTWTLAASAGTIVWTSSFAIAGVLMDPIGLPAVSMLLAVVAVFTLALDLAKVQLVARL